MVLFEPVEGFEGSFLAGIRELAWILATVANRIEREPQMPFVSIVSLWVGWLHPH